MEMYCSAFMGSGKFLFSSFVFLSIIGLLFNNHHIFLSKNNLLYGGVVDASIKGTR